MSAKSKFVNTRDNFYNDLAEAFAAGESLHIFLVRRRDFCIEHGQNGVAAIYDSMIERMDESGELFHVVGPVVPVNDGLSLRSIDSGSSDAERARMLRALAYAIKRKRQMSKILWKAVTGPLIALPIVTILPLIISFQMPVMEDLVPPSKWGVLGGIFYWICYFIRTYCYVIGAALVSGFALFIWSFSNWSGDLRSKFDKYPPYSIYRDLAASGFLSAMAEFMGIRKPLVESLIILKNGATPWMSRRIDKTLENLEERPGDYGYAFATSMLSPELQLRLTTYAERGNSAGSADSAGSGGNDGFSDGLMKLGTDGLDHVVDSVEKNAVWIGLAATIATVVVIVTFYGGNTLVSSIVSDTLTEEAENQSN